LALAEKLALKALELNSTHPPCWNLLTLIYCAQDNIKSALSACYSGLKIIEEKGSANPTRRRYIRSCDREEILKYMSNSFRFFFFKHSFYNFYF